MAEEITELAEITPPEKTSTIEETIDFTAEEWDTYRFTQISLHFIRINPPALQIIAL